MLWASNFYLDSFDMLFSSLELLDPYAAPTRLQKMHAVWGYIRIMEKNMETTTLYWGYIGIMEKKMEAIKKGVI